ncbi:hypothetical protein CGMCC3_g17991 [Colletotrichum fructicola]|nr:uncharacterized protein CGMCC3_g17991 [Colletotrichum fructicola]KAE9565828.1 hypothetical protein CGMCC3_g17991 [Colletotrichum fructicola]
MDPSIVTNGNGLARRACRKSTEVQVMSDDQFFNWDVAISPILSSHRGTTRASTSKGYSVGNSVSTLASTVPEGQHGLVVSQPLVRRVTGRLLTGCSHRPISTPFTSDTYTDQSFGNLDFVKSVIRLCNTTVYPVLYYDG